MNLIPYQRKNIDFLILFLLKISSLLKVLSSSYMFFIQSTRHKLLLCFISLQTFQFTQNIYLFIPSSMSSQIIKSQEINSIISTNYSQNGPRTPLSLNILPLRQNMGYKKFTRKKDSSIDLIRKCLEQKTAPKITHKNKQDRELLNKTLDAIPESEINKIIKTNSFIKLTASSVLQQKLEPFQIDKISLRTDQQAKGEKKKEKYKGQNNSISVTKTQQKKLKLTIQQIEGFPTTTDKQKAEGQIQRKKMSKTSNYETPYTDREKKKRLQFSPSEDIKVLFNEIIILQDENSRLKKQIIQLTSQKQEQRMKREELQNKIKVLEDSKKEYEWPFFQSIMKNIHQIYLQIVEMMENNRGNIQYLNEKVINSNEQNIFTNKNKVQLTAENFIYKFMEPAISVINEKIKEYSKLFQYSKIQLNKLQIRQNVMMRSTFELENSRVQNRMLNERLSVQRNKSIKLKQMYETLKNSQLEETKPLDRKKKMSSEKAVTLSQKSSKNQQTSFILSDFSDDQLPKNSKRIDKRR